jgi:hypothetical protein
MILAIKLDKSKLVRNLVAKNKYIMHVERALEKEEFTWSAEFSPKEPDDAFHPSGDCTPSVHQLWNKVTGGGSDNKIGAGLRKTFAVGHFWHAYLQFVTVEILEFASWDNIERRGETRWGEGPFKWACGSGDVAPATLPIYGDYLIDFKTMNSFDFRKNQMPNWTADKWECQTNIYMDWFNLDKAIIVGIQKDSPHDMKEFEFHRNQPLIDAIYKKWKLVGACIDEDVEPPADEDIPLPLNGAVQR